MIPENERWGTEQSALFAMFVIIFFRFITGTVKFAALGGFPERFINLCAQAKIPMWSVSSRGGELTAHVPARKYRKLRPFARRAGVRLRVKERHGLPFFLHKYRKRIGIAVGITLFAIFIWVMSLFIWVIQIVGDVPVSNEKILETLSGLGLRPGVLSSAIDAEDLQRRALLELPELSWIAVNIRGSSAVVEVRERTLPPEGIPDDRPCNIKAAAAGQILEINAYAGEPVVKVGDAVAEGDLLVSGAIEDSVGHTLLRHARAEVIALTQYTLSAEVPLSSTEQVSTDRVIDQKSINLFGLCIPLYIGGAPEGCYTHTSSEKPLFGAASFLSVRIDRYSEYEEKAVELTMEEAEARCREEIAAEEEHALYSIEVVNRSEEVIRGGEACKVTIAYLCKENIAKEEEIFTDR